MLALNTLPRFGSVLGGLVALAVLVTAAPGIAGASSSTGSNSGSGAGREDLITKGCPSNMALVGSSCVDKYEGSLVEVREDGTDAPFSAYEPPNGKHVRAVSRAGVTPQAHISMVEAKSACSASGKRLCKAQEWKSACKGPDQTKFPYGASRVANACVDTDRTSPINKLHSGEHTARTLNDPALNQQSGTVEPTGEAAQCTNGYGVHDMVGNVHEWTDDGSFRGGYYLDTTLNGDGCDYRTTAHSPVYYDYSTGFRCCADAGFEDESPSAKNDSERETLAKAARGSEPTKVTFTEPTKIPGVRTATATRADVSDVGAGPVETRSEG
jgi:formylglycine-generating enzyme